MTTADRLRDQNVCIPLPLGRLAADELDALTAALAELEAVIAAVQAALDQYDRRAEQWAGDELHAAVAKAVRP